MRLGMHGSFVQRRLEGELMDDSELSRPAHEAALNGLRRVNLASRTAAALWPTLAGIAKRSNHPRTHLLDVASGGGDVAISIARRAQRAGLALDISGCDISKVAIEYATARAKDAGVAAAFFHLDCLADSIPKHYDIITTTLFLHHLANADIVTLLKKLAAHCDHLLVSDLIRSPLGYGLAWAGTHLLSASRIVHIDALRSVRAALSVEEAQSLATSAGLADARFEPCWPRRFLMHWQRPTERNGEVQT